MVAVTVTSAEEWMKRYHKQVGNTDLGIWAFVPTVQFRLGEKEVIFTPQEWERLKQFINTI